MDRIPDWGRSQIAIIVEYGIEHGLAPDTCFQNTAITEDTLSQVDPTKSEELQVIRNVLDAINKPAFEVGVAIGKRCDIRTFGVLGQALMSSKNIIEAGHLAAKYLTGELHFIRIRINKQPDGIYTYYDLQDSHEQCIEHFLVARDMGATIAFHDHVFRSTPEFLLEIGFKFDWQPGMEMLEEHFDCEVKVKQANNYTKGNHLLSLIKMPFSNSFLFKQFDRQLEKLVKARHVKQPTHSLKQRVIRQLEQRDYQSISREDMAKLLNVSSRTLARYLQSEGTSWRCLISSIRLNKAKELLSEGTHSVESVAYLVGYSSPSAFSAAFSRECGKSPNEYKENLSLSQSD